MTRARVWVAFLLLGLAWGSSYLFIRIGDRQLTPLALVALRLFIAAVGILVAAAVLRPDLRLTRRQGLMAVVIATVGTSLPFLLITWAEKTVPSGLTAVLNSTTPIFSVLIAAAVLGDEPLTVPRAGGVAIGFAGVVMLASRDLAHGAIHWSQAAGQGAVVLASACYAVSAVLTRRSLRGVPTLTFAVYVLCISAAQLTTLSLIFSPPPISTLRPASVVAVVWLGLLGSAIAYLLYFFIIQSWGASRATLVTYVIPVVGLALGAIFLGEVLDIRILAGSVLVICGVVVASLVGTQATTDVETPAPASGEAVGAESLPERPIAQGE